MVCTIAPSRPSPMKTPESKVPTSSRSASTWFYPASDQNAMQPQL